MICSISSSLIAIRADSRLISSPLWYKMWNSATICNYLQLFGGSSKLTSTNTSGSNSPIQEKHLNIYFALAQTFAADIFGFLILKNPDGLLIPSLFF